MDKELEIFNTYYETFGDYFVDIERKYFHTFRVMEYASRIAESLGLNEEDVTLAKICALFHDIGRFPQWAMYQTYDDKKSLDHGDKSYEVLKEFGYDNEIVLIAVQDHNKYAVRDGLTDRQKLFANITRDADKIDIMLTQGLGCNDEEFIVDDMTKEDIDNKRLVRNHDNNSDTFNIFRMLSFIYDLNYKESFNIINKANLINSKFDLLADKFGEDKVHEYRVKFDSYVKERID